MKNCLLVLLTTVVAWANSLAYQNDAGGQGTSYDYQDYDNQEYDEEPQPSLIPQFEIEAQHFKVAKDRVIRLPCRVDQLGPMVISWKKADPDGSNLQYLATGSHSLSRDSRISVEEATNGKGSTLVISFANDQDVGEYICEVSSNPPATLRHHVSLIVQPSVDILKPPYELYQIKNGEELALVCRGHGDPMPTLSWRRQRKKMPDGHEKIQGAQVIYSNVTRKHSGTYICEGSNGSGYVANDSIKIDVIHPPEITGEQSYIQDGLEGIIKLELVCIVHASPKATVSWYKNGRLVQPSERILIEKISRKHLFTIKNLDEIQDAGTYTCHAKNSLGEFKENFHLQVSSSRDSSLVSQNSSQTWFKDYIYIEHDGAMADDTNTMVEPIRALGGAPPVFQNSMILSFVIFPSLIYFIL